MHGPFDGYRALDPLQVREIGHEYLPHRLRDDLSGRGEQEQQHGCSDGEDGEQASS